MARLKDTAQVRMYSCDGKEYSPECSCGTMITTQHRSENKAARICQELCGKRIGNFRTRERYSPLRSLKSAKPAEKERRNHRDDGGDKEHDWNDP